MPALFKRQMTSPDNSNLNLALDKEELKKLQEEVARDLKAKPVIPSTVASPDFTAYLMVIGGAILFGMGVMRLVK